VFLVGCAGTAQKAAPRGGEHDWVLTYNAKILMPWLRAETANVCQKCSAIAIVTFKT
jgi:hypothetical protein